ncbi:MAG: hypothetical protein GY835_05260 [bacterium]|nr:hypothetical protein [bacterium]
MAMKRPGPPHHAPKDPEKMITFVINVTVHEAGHGTQALHKYAFDMARGSTAESGSAMETNLTVDALAECLRDFSEEDAALLRAALNPPIKK